MRSPSNRVLINRANIFLAQNTVDTDGGPQWVYPTTPTYRDLPCTAQCMGFEQIVDDQDRVTQVYEWKIMFASFLGLTPRDQIAFVDGGGVVHTVLFEAIRDNANRGAAFTIKAIERL